MGVDVTTILFLNSTTMTLHKSQKDSDKEALVLEALVGIKSGKYKS